MNSQVVSSATVKYKARWGMESVGGRAVLDWGSSEKASGEVTLEPMPE